MTARRPFDGIRVAEFGRYVAVPYAAELFAHGGADVLKFEEIEGDETRRNSEIIPGEGRQFIIKARGKRDIAINLAVPDGLGVARRLLHTCDVVLSNLRPGALGRLGLDYETVSRDVPGIIYGEISGFGSGGPDADRASIDGVMQAYSGFLVSNRSWEGDRPVISEAFLSDYMSAMTLAFGVTVALRERDRTGRGQQVRTSLFAAALALQHGTANVFDAVDGWKREFVNLRETTEMPGEEWLARRRAQAPGNRWFYNSYATRDGFIVIGAAGRLRYRLAEILGVDDPALAPGWQMPDDPRPYLDEMYLKAKAAIATWPTSALADACHAAGIPVSPVRSLEEALLGRQAREAGLVYEADHPAVGPMTMPQAPVQFSDLDYRAASRSPGYGEDTIEILREAGYAPDEIAALVDSRVVGTPDTSPFHV